MVDKTVAEFCAAKHFGRSTYYELKRRGLGPQETCYPGTQLKRISHTAEQAWDRKMAELAQGDAAKLGAARRVEIARHAGKAAAASPKHISRTRSARRSRQARNLLERSAAT